MHSLPQSHLIMENSNNHLQISPLIGSCEAIMTLPPKPLADHLVVDHNNSTKRPRRYNNGNAEEQKSVGGRGPGWKDSWVVHLIHARGELNEEFAKPPRQGVDLWSKVCNKLLSTCPKFDKNAESCRKKWQMIYKLYKEDKAAERLSGDQNPKKCNWFHLIDEYMHNCTHHHYITVAAQDANLLTQHDADVATTHEVGLGAEYTNIDVHYDVDVSPQYINGVPPPQYSNLAPGMEANESDCEVNIDVSPTSNKMFKGMVGNDVVRIPATPKKAKESSAKVDGNLKVDDFLAKVSARMDKMVENSSELLRRFDHYEREKITMLSNLNETLKGFMSFLKE